ncbi:hypothetical protein PRZ48_010905 [Zasmidium cellare]|uniref:Uncharacterized protein n=1 Tax=Zasmidium cellare TaxID=395010 RepID=A0ABR0EAB7_ZASCE|nr:hypothetical protein PRZ48_010905 [Zasmidium cellare]
MCYKIPHLWSCNHVYAWSPVHCTAATARHLEPTQHCEHLIDPEDPEWKIKEEMVCPDCQRKAESSSEDGGEGAKADAGEKGKEVAGDKALEHELAALERELEDLEMGDLEAALRESAHHHTLLHDTHLEEAKKNSLAEAPEQQSLDAHVQEMSKAKEASVRHWEEELGMGVYRNHERAVQRARLESYRELLEGYRRLKGQLRGDVGEGEGEAGVKEGGEGSGGVEVEAGSSTPRSLSIATTTPKRRWAFQDDEHRELYEDDNDASSARSSTGRVRHASGEGVAVDPAESFVRRPTSHASSRRSSQPAAGEEGAQPGLVLPGDEGDDDGEQRHRRRSLLKRLRPGGGDKK